MLRRRFAIAFASLALMSASAGAARAATSYDIGTNNVIRLQSDGVSHTILVSPAKLTGSWHITGTLNVIQATGAPDLACYAGGTRVDLFLNQNANTTGIVVVDAAVHLPTAQTVGFNCIVYSNNAAASIEALDANLTLVPVANVVTSVQVAPQN